MRMNNHVPVLLLAVALALCPVAARATTLFTAFLSGSEQVPVNFSPATGFGTVVLNDPMDQITVDLSWTGLTSPATAAHIHGAAGPGVNAAVMFPFSGVPNVTSGSIPEQVFAITPTQVGYLQGGLLYFNVHDAQFPGGEIRGQIHAAVPEPKALTLLALGLAALSGLSVLSRREA
jgi:hypothetical protein